MGHDHRDTTSASGDDPAHDPEPGGPAPCHGGADADTHCHEARGRDWLLTGSLVAIALAFAIDAAPLAGLPAFVTDFSAHVVDVVARMWWGMLASLVAVCLLSRVPREFVIAVLGRPGPVGIGRATLAGVLLDMCSHGILLVASRLYERGASTGQVIAFLIASPWNSLALTAILISLVGLPLTLTYIVCSMGIAFVSGVAFDRLVGAGRLPANPNETELPKDFRFFREATTRLAASRWGRAELAAMMRDGLAGSRMVLRWVLAGIVLAAAIRTGLAPETFQQVFGPTLAGLGATLLAATALEVCSEGSAPIAGDLVARGGAPGNAFAFLMAGVSTDYTEILVLREMTGSTRFALVLPLVTLPQIVAIGWLMNRTLA